MSSVSDKSSVHSEHLADETVIETSKQPSNVEDGKTQVNNDQTTDQTQADGNTQNPVSTTANTSQTSPTAPDASIGDPNNTKESPAATDPPNDNTPQDTTAVTPPSPVLDPPSDPPPQSTATNVTIPTNTSLRHMGRSANKSHVTFMDFLAKTTESFLNIDNRHSSAVQIALDQALGDNEQYVRMLKTRLDNCPNDPEADIEHYKRCLKSAHALARAMTKAYGDRIEELTRKHDDNNSIYSISNKSHKSNSKPSTNKSKKTGRSSSSKKAQAALRLEQLRLEEEYEAKMLQERLEHQKRELDRQKEKLLLQQEIDSSDSEGTVLTVNTKTTKSSARKKRRKRLNTLDPPIQVPDDVEPLQTIDNISHTAPSHRNSRSSYNNACSDSSIIDKLLHLKVMERRDTKYDGNPLRYTSFRNEFNLIMSKFPADRHYLFNELLASLTGPALDAVEHCRDLLCNIDSAPDALDTALAVLKRDFGSEYQVREAHLKTITDTTKKVEWDQPSFRKLLSDLEKCQALLSSSSQKVYLDSPDTIMAVVERMPHCSKSRFVSRCATLNDPSNPGFKFLISFVENELRQTSMSFAKLLAQKPASHQHKGKENTNSKGRFNHRSYCADADTADSSSTCSAETPLQASSNAAEHNPASKRVIKPPEKLCHYCKGNHRMQDCDSFNRLSIDQRCQFIEKAGNICRACFGSHHLSKCKSKYHCKYCKKKEHNSKLCRNKPSDNSQSTSAEIVANAESTPPLIQATAASTTNYPVYVRVVAVTARNESGDSVPLYALLDSGSMITLCSTRIASRLKLSGDKCTLNLQGVNTRQKIDTHLVSFTVKGVHPAAESFQLKSVPCVGTLPSHSVSIPATAITARHTHLSDITFPSVTSDQIDLIIGADNDNLHQVLECRSSENSDLRGYLTPLGWALAGTDNQASTSTNCILASTYFSSTSNRVLHSHYGVDISDNVLETVRDMMHVCKEGKYDEELAHSVEDEAVLDLFVNQRTKAENGHFVLPIPFRDKDVNIPNNRSCAETRLRSLTKMLRKNKDLHDFYVDKMKSMHTKRYMLESSSARKSQRNIVYLHHFPTRQTKRRIVLDAAASDLGKSFNSHLMQGPDMMQPLVDVLLRFRQDAVAFACDIKEMFHQVQLPTDGKVSLRILWYKDHNIDGPMQDYVLTVHPFGLKSSPAAANFSVRQTALDNESGASQETVNVMLNQLYVDDCLNSEESSEIAITRIHELNELAATSGFEFVKYTSNNRDVLNSIDPDSLVPDLRAINLRQDGLPTHKALGVYWDPSADVFTFRISIEDKPDSKRGMLSMLCRVFDPLGMALPYLMTGRRIMQEAFACTQPDDWDSPLPDYIRCKWNSWQKHLILLETITIPRCYHVTGQRPDKYEIHTFADASNVGVSAVSFIRYSKDNCWGCSFIRGKGHVIPKDTSWSTARYELEAAVLAATLHSDVSNAVNLPISRSFLWTDSATVLTWLNNTSRRPKVFVYNRRKEILRHSDRSQWRYVNTLFNPADLATRGVPTNKIAADCPWLRGPEFLLHPDADWPIWILPGVNDADLELLPERSSTATQSLAVEETSSTKKPPDTPLVCKLSPSEKVNLLLWKYSSLQMLVKVIAWLRRISTKSKSVNLSCGEIDQALLTAVKLAQKEYYSPCVIEKIQRLGFNETLSLTSDKKVKGLLSNIQKLSPYVDDAGLLRVGGRLQNSALPQDMIHPIILPRRHQVTRLIIEDQHSKNRHFGGVKYVMSLLASRFWINHSTVKFYLDRCLSCVRIRARTGSQIMAPLPAARVTAGGHPFAATGVDYFGPILVKVKRSEVKRWVALFTCLATRAIHIEKVHTLETNSFLQAFNRFRCTRNGSVKTLYSDNASTFHGADIELQRAVARLEEEGFRERLRENGVDWHFNPPLASHQGGVWERMIRSVRKVLLGIPALERTMPNDEMLDTVLKEAECIVNNRPLTAIDGDFENVPALTPGMLLIGSLAPATPFDVVHNSDELKRNWRYTQVAAEQFWDRFIKEYIKHLQPRPKWYRSCPNFKLGDVVLVKEIRFNYRPNYPKALITKLNPGPDGLVRSVELRFPDGRRLVRDIRKVVPLQCVEEC